MPTLDAEGFRARTGVSRETLDRLIAYDVLLRKWQPRINLVGPATLPESWSRHFLDSAQLFPVLGPEVRTLVDLGSGAGFPGLVLAILGVGEVHLVESDTRKVAFLREAARETGTSVTIHPRRIDAVQGIAADAVTARALAPLASLLAWAYPLIGDHGVGVFPKGQNVDQELTEATRSWKMAVERVESATDPSGSILRIRELSPR
jgi:16S rRNA (guanine527-N7)-methyltransferase